MLAKIFTTFFLLSLSLNLYAQLVCNDYFFPPKWQEAITVEEVVANAKLSEAERFSQGLKKVGIDPEKLQNLEREQLRRALLDSHEAGSGAVYEYSWRELRAKYRILTEGGFTPAQAEALLRYGFAGRPPSRELINPGRTLFSNFASDVVDGKYLQKRDELRELMSNTYGSKSKQIWDNLESLYFIDYAHSSKDLMKVLKGQKSISALKINESYGKKAYNNFHNTREWLLDSKPKANKETLLEIQRRMMKGGIDDIEADGLGKIREDFVYGNVPSIEPIDQKAIDIINANPYLTWVKRQEIAGGKFSGEIYYPNCEFVRKKALDKIRTKQPTLVKTIEEFQGLPEKIDDAVAKVNLYEVGTQKYKDAKKILDALEKRYNEISLRVFELNRKLVDSLTDDLLDWFTRQRSEIGAISTPDKLDDFIDLVAEFQRNLVSIHPMVDGNGRTTREFASYLIMREGFPPPRIINTDADLYSSLNDWKIMIKHGMLSTEFMLDDLAERMRFGLPIENSMDFIAPYSRPPKKVGLKGKNAGSLEGVEYVDPRLHREIVKRIVKENPELIDELYSDPLKAWDKIHAEVGQVFAKNNIYYKHPKKGLERLEIGYVDDDFKLLFGKASFDQPELFNFKLKTWYSEDLVWRGLADQQTVKSEKEIIKMFKELSDHMASNRVINTGATTPAQIRKEALKDFEQYNDQVFGEGLVKMAKDHSETGPLYDVSYGFSTSKDRKVGKAFAMGAMVIADYGSQMNPELQQLLKSRILVGARRSVKDVDLGRLKQLRPEFSYKYGRQQEVMGIGASDPDSISIIQSLGPDGEPLLTYLRNPEKPNQIWVVNGDIDPNKKPTAAQLVKTITLD